jgi:hypothetical protein
MLRTHHDTTPAQQPTPAVGPRFSCAERAVLLATPGIGHGVVERIESIGVHTLQQLHDMGVDVIVAQICASFGNVAWRNRRRPLKRALQQAWVTARPTS